jgi:hypothetical protein
MDGKHIIDIRWGRDRTNNDNLTLTFEQIRLAVEFDLAHNYCRVGDTILEQVEGCPIGGLLSALYANIYCAYDEREFMKRWEHVEDQYYAIRQMDDMLMVIRWDPEDEKMQDELLKMRKDVGENLYTGGLKQKGKGRLCGWGKRHEYGRDFNLEWRKRVWSVRLTTRTRSRWKKGKDRNSQGTLKVTVGKPMR